jgi:hypothetical protein
MAIELTDQQRSLLNQGNGQPVEFLDSQTNQIYVLIAREKYDQGKTKKDGQVEPPLPEVAEGIRRSQEALRRDLPALLENKKLRGQWAAYHGDERIGISKRMIILERECIKRGFESNEYYIGWIDPCELIEEEELEPRPWHTARD